MVELNEEIPNNLFDAQLNIQATLAANAASSQGNQANRHFLQKWRRFYAGKVGPIGRIDIGSVARFLLGVGEEERGGVAGITAAREEAGQSLAEDKKAQKKAFRKKAKLMNDLFGPGRGHGITENNEAKGVQNRTVPLEVATLYVLNDWVKEQNLVLKEKESWDAMRARWTAEGIPKKERDRMEAKSLLEILQCMPVFMMQNGGAYYFEMMLLWAIVWQEHPYKLFRYIHDHGNRKGKMELARELAVEQPMPREWWAALWKEEMAGIGTVREVIGGAPIDPHLQLEGQEAAGGASTSAAGAVGRAEGGALAPLSAFASFDSVLGHLGDVTVQGPQLANRSSSRQHSRL
jgi:hypothetical protein